MLAIDPWLLDIDPAMEGGLNRIPELAVPSSENAVAAGEKREEARLGMDMEPPAGALCTAVKTESDSPTSDMVARCAGFVMTVREEGAATGEII